MSKITVPFSKDRKPLQELLPLDQPLRIEIDPADVCNFHCDFCFQDRVAGFHKGSLITLETFELIINQLKDFSSPISKVYLYALGEPLLHPDIVYFIRRLKEEGVAKTVAITTNGSCLKHELSIAMVDAGLDQLSISVNGLCDADFERICHAKVNFDNYISEIRWFYEHKGNCYLHVKLEGDYFSNQEKERFYKIFEGICDTMHIDHVADIWPDLPIESNKNLYDLKSEGNHPVCPQPFYDLCIHPDGTVTPCDAIWDYHRYQLGNIYDSSLKDIWQGKAHHGLCIDQLTGGPCTMDICNRCRFAEFGASVDISPYSQELLEKYIRKAEL